MLLTPCARGLTACGRGDRPVDISRGIRVCAAGPATPKPTLRSRVVSLEKGETARSMGVDRALRNVANEGAGMADPQPGTQSAALVLRRLMVSRMAWACQTAVTRRLECDLAIRRNGRGRGPCWDALPARAPLKTAACRPPPQRQRPYGPERQRGPFASPKTG